MVDHDDREGRSNETVSYELGISIRTVSTHLHRIFTKLEVRSRAAMLARLTELPPTESLCSCTLSALTRIDAFERPVTDDAGAPVAVLLARQDETANRPLTTLVIPIEQIDGHDPAS